MKKAVGCIVILIMLMTAMACELVEIGNAEKANVNREARLAQQPVRGEHGQRFEGRFIERMRLQNPGLNDEELKALLNERFQAHQARRERGEGQPRDFENRQNRFMERMRLQNPGLNDEELKALIKERFQAREANRERGEGRHHRENGGKRPHGHGRHRGEAQT